MLNAKTSHGHIDGEQTGIEKFTKVHRMGPKVHPEDARRSAQGQKQLFGAFFGEHGEER